MQTFETGERMTTRSRTTWLTAQWPIRWALVCLGGLVLQGKAMATLGEAWPNSAAVPTSQSAAQKQTLPTRDVQMGLYSMHESKMENGTTVREFVNADGRVFAVTWQGPVLPDFQALLGSHFAALDARARQARRPGISASPLGIDNGDVVLRTSGRMRHFVGHAYVPSLVPAGVNIPEIIQ